MQFKEAAFEILKDAGKPLHYQEITALAIASGLLETVGRTPEATMGSRLYTDTLKPDSRFQRGDAPGTFSLRIIPPNTFNQQIEKIQRQVRRDLRKQLLVMPPKKFEELIRLLLEQMGFEETETTPYSNDHGVDVRGVLRSNPLSLVKVAVQVKRWSKNIGSEVVRNLRGSLNILDSEQGIMITPGDFSASAKEEAQSGGRTPIRLINGDQLVDLLIQYNVGVKNEQYVVPAIDVEYWTEILGVRLDEEANSPAGGIVEINPVEIARVAFPLDIQANYHQQVYYAQLVNLQGVVRYNNQEFSTPTAAARSIVEWRTVNGWDFWRFTDPLTGNQENIGSLRQSQNNLLIN